MLATSVSSKARTAAPIGRARLTCSGDQPLPASNNHDIVGVIANGSSTPEFYFQNFVATLSRARRTGTNTWVYHEELNVPSSVNVSLVATPSQASVGNKITLGFIGTDNLAHTIRINPTDFPAANAWTSQVALPNGVTPITTKASFAGIAYHGTTNGTAYDREKIWVIGSDFGLYQIATSNPSGDWYTSWAGPFFSPSGYMGSVGVATTTTGDPGRQPRVFGAIGYPTYTLQEFASATTTFKDYIKFQNYPQSVGNAGIAVAETAAAADNSLAIMTGRRQPKQEPVRFGQDLLLEAGAGRCLVHQRQQLPDKRPLRPQHAHLLDLESANRSTRRRTAGY